MSCARVRALPLFAFLQISAAAAPLPPASSHAVLDVPTSQVPIGQTSVLGLSARVDLTQQLRVDVLAALAGWNRAELDLALPILLQVDPSHLAVGALQAGGKLVLLARPEGARGAGLALFVGASLPLHDFDVVRFEVYAGLALDVQLGRNILVATYASAGASARYHLEDPAFQSFAAGAAVRVPIIRHLDFLADLAGRVDVPGGTKATAETAIGLRLHVGRVFVTGSIGTGLTEPSLLAGFTVLAGSGQGLLHPTERDDVEPPEDLCFETRCTLQQRAAVRRAVVPRIEEIRKQLVALAALVELRIREKAGASDGRDALHLTILNDLSILGDADRKRELSVRFLLAAFARSGIPIDRALAETLLDDTGWQVQAGREIGEARVDYFTFDMLRLYAAYTNRLRWNAEHLQDAIRALRAADAGTTEILLDIARGHANGLIAVTNGLLDLPLAPVNLGLFLAGRETIHGLGRIPQVEYKSDWGHKFGGSMELGVALGTMTAPGASIFTGLGRTIAPAVSRLDELSKLVWNGLPIGRFLQALLVKWMQGSVLAVKAHAATEAGVLLRALITREIELPDGSTRLMTADDFGQIVLALTQDIVIVAAAMRAEEGAREAEPGGRPSRGETVVPGAGAKAMFRGIEIRGMRDLSHLSDSTLRVMADEGFAPKDIDGRPLVLHHHRQNPAGFVVEMPAGKHSIGNPRQHPYGNAPGVGLTPAERAAFDDWRVSYWKARARGELARRGR